MFGLPNFVFYLIAGVIGAFSISWGRWLGHKYIPHFPDVPFILGSLVMRGKPERTVRIAGRYIHLISYALWGLLFGLLIEKQFFFVEFNIAQGIVFAVFPWLFFMAIVKPLTGDGFFGVKVSGYRWLTSLALHILYGAVLGGLLSVFIGQTF